MPRILVLAVVMLAFTYQHPTLAKRAALPARSETEIERAVVVIEATTQRADWFSPWQRARTTGATGSGPRRACSCPVATGLQA